MEFAGKHIQSVRSLSKDNRDANVDESESGSGDPEALRGASQTLKDMDALIQALQERRKNGEQQGAQDYLERLQDEGREDEERPWKEGATEFPESEDSAIDAENSRLENELERLRDIRRRQTATDPKPMGGFRRVAKYGLSKKQLESLQHDTSSTKTYEDTYVLSAGGKSDPMRRAKRSSDVETPESSPLEVPSAENCEAEGDLEITKINSIVGELNSFADEISNALMKFDIVDNSGTGSSSSSSGGSSSGASTSTMK